jgi:seryl-tRNA synthetase
VNSLSSAGLGAGSLLAVPGSATGLHLATDAQQMALMALRAAITELFAQEQAPVCWAPPVIAKSTVERTGYHETFPHLLAGVTTSADPGSGHAPGGADGLVLVPAACHHLYPLFAGREVQIPTSIAVECHCFRSEASAERGRLRSFLMREVVHVAEPAVCEKWRDNALQRIEAWLQALGLEVTVQLADDPFFGPGARLLRASQREQALKWEVCADLGGGTPQAVASCNYHKDHFSAAFGFHGPDDGVVHSACAAFGLERLVLALAHRHGPDPEHWPL